MKKCGLIVLGFYLLAQSSYAYYLNETVIDVFPKGSRSAMTGKEDYLDIVFDNDHTYTYLHCSECNEGQAICLASSLMASESYGRNIRDRLPWWLLYVLNENDAEDTDIDTDTEYTREIESVEFAREDYFIKFLNGTIIQLPDGVKIFYYENDYQWVDAILENGEHIKYGHVPVCYQVDGAWVVDGRVLADEDTGDDTEVTREIEGIRFTSEGYFMEFTNGTEIRLSEGVKNVYYDEGDYLWVDVILENGEHIKYGHVPGCYEVDGGWVVDGRILVDEGIRDSTEVTKIENVIFVLKDYFIKFLNGTIIQLPEGVKNAYYEDDYLWVDVILENGEHIRYGHVPGCYIADNVEVCVDADDDDDQLGWKDYTRVFAIYFLDQLGLIDLNTSIGGEIINVFPKNEAVVVHKRLYLNKKQARHAFQYIKKAYANSFSGEIIFKPLLYNCIDYAQNVYESAGLDQDPNFGPFDSLFTKHKFSDEDATILDAYRARQTNEIGLMDIWRNFKRWRFIWWSLRSS